MRVAKRLGLALGVAVALHAGLLFFALAPKLDGLFDAPAAPRRVAVPVAEETPPADSTLDVGWAAPPDEPAGRVEPVEPLPTLSPEPQPTEVAPAPALAVVTGAPRRLPRPLRPPVRPIPAPAAGGPPGAAPAVVTADNNYANRVRQHLSRFAGALPAGANGEARVQFVVQTDGRVSDVVLVRLSGNAELDAIALSLPAKSQPLPLPGAAPQRLEVPVQAIAAGPPP